jgi:large subunit ribosomal protein L30
MPARSLEAAVRLSRTCGVDMARLRITLVKSTIGSLPKHRKTVRALGLRKTQQSVEKDDNPAIRGMVSAVSHMVRLEEIS